MSSGIGCAVVGLVALAAAGCSPTAEGSLTRSAAQAVGWATTVGEPKDFVVARRSNAPLDYVPVGRGGIERPVQPRDAAGVRALEADLDSVRDRSEAFARRPLPSGAYGQPLPSVAAPPRAARGTSGQNLRPDPNAPASYPVSASRVRQMRENARAAGQTTN